MLAGFGPTGIVLIILVFLLLFGSRKLPELGRSVGRTLKEFKQGVALSAEEAPEMKERIIEVKE